MKRVDPTNSRRVALKLIERGSDPDSMQVVAAERLGVELHKRLCALDPRVTAVYEFGETPDFLYIVMEYVDGRDLSELAAQQQLGHLFRRADRAGCTGSARSGASLPHHH
jgi:serine/threonine protein kinase